MSIRTNFILMQRSRAIIC